jgi:hypothetical protein
MPASSLERSSLEDELVDGRRLVVLAAYNTPIEAQIARSRLEIEGIAADLLDENTVSIGTHLALAVGGVKLRIFEDDLEHARDVLNNMGEFELPEGDDDDDDALIVAKEEESAEALAARAFSSGVISALFFPPLGLYSLWLVWRALRHKEPLEAKGRRKAVAATAFDVVALAWLAFVLEAIL